MPTPKVIHQPRAQEAIGRGVSALVNAIRPTLGPLPRKLVAQNQHRFELLDDGGTIARRIIALEDREADVGAMLLRQTLWQMREQVGDGTATTAVIYEKVYSEGLRFIAAGCDPMRLRAELLRLLPPLLAATLSRKRLLMSRDDLRGIAFSMCYDEDMAAVLAEVIDCIGPWGQVDIRAGHGRGMAHEYVEGAYWKGGAQSKDMLRGGRSIAEMSDASILVTDIDIKEARDLVPIMQLALRMGIKDLLLIVKSITDVGLSVVLDERLRQKINTVVVKIDSYFQDELLQSCRDIALLTGGVPLLGVAGDSLEAARAQHFGRARWVWADDKNFGFAGGAGNAVKVREQARQLRRAYACADDDDSRERLLKRLGQFNGGLATVQVGGIADDEIKTRKELAERTVRALRLARMRGVIPGGGVSLLDCRHVLADAAADEALEARSARQILDAALQAPIRAMLENAGYDSSEALARLSDYGCGVAYDLMRGQIVDMAAAGVFDVAEAQTEALQRAVKSAALALTIDALVLHREPETMTEP